MIFLLKPTFIKRFNCKKNSCSEVTAFCLKDVCFKNVGRPTSSCTALMVRTDSTNLLRANVVKK